MRQLHPEAIAAIQAKALFSQAEEALLAKISSVRHFSRLLLLPLNIICQQGVSLSLYLGYVPMSCISLNLPSQTLPEIQL